MKAGSVVLVRWHDAGSGATEEEAAGHHRVSVGFLVKRNRAGIWLSMESDQLSGIHFIKRSMLEGSPKLLSEPQENPDTPQPSRSTD